MYPRSRHSSCLGIVSPGALLSFFAGLALMLPARIKSSVASSQGFALCCSTMGRAFRRAQSRLEVLPSEGHICSSVVAKTHVAETQNLVNTLHML